ncbi:hypothetical protein B0H34DRAFT_672679 [Crassisporium funariophilum]|nr:hypothetical protein B0H34DRAFT_680136 [Crassisporium funariophilum]KAF8163744.1 hypothetical protein B0H34DRAFT_672679 [Crassisporium funariophilum]
MADIPRLRIVHIKYSYAYAATFLRLALLDIVIFLFFAQVNQFGSHETHRNGGFTWTPRKYAIPSGVHSAPSHIHARTGVFRWDDEEFEVRSSNLQGHLNLARVDRKGGSIRSVIMYQHAVEYGDVGGWCMGGGAESHREHS